MTAEASTGEAATEQRGKGGQPPGGDAIYALGIVGAAVFYWQRADTPGARALGVLKGLVWPAFMVYEGFSALADRSPSSEPS